MNTYIYNRNYYILDYQLVNVFYFFGTSIEQGYDRYKSFKLNIMRTLDNNQLTGTTKNTKSFVWNSKRRFR